jgi:hypothetical protein
MNKKPIQLKGKYKKFGGGGNSENSYNTTMYRTPQYDEFGNPILPQGDIQTNGNVIAPTQLSSLPDGRYNWNASMNNNLPSFIPQTQNVVETKSQNNDDNATINSYNEALKIDEERKAREAAQRKANFWGAGSQNPYIGGNLNSRAYDLGYYAKQGNPLGIITSGLGLGLGVGKSLFNGMGDANQLQIASNNYNTKTRNAMVRPMGYTQDLLANKYLRDGYSYAEGGTFDPVSLAVANDRALAEQSGMANAEVEDGEYVNQGGTIKQAVGERHEDGGVKVNLEQGDRVLTDRTELGRDKAKMLEKEYKIKVKPKHTYSEAMEKLNAKIGMTKVVEEQEKIMGKLAKNEQVQDEATKAVNESLLGRKLEALEAKRVELEETQNFLYNVLYGMQEVDKKKNDKGNFERVDVKDKEILEGAVPTNEGGNEMMANGGEMNGKSYEDINAMYATLQQNPYAFANPFEMQYMQRQEENMFAGGGKYMTNTFLPTPDPNLTGYEYDPTLVAGTFETNVIPTKNNYIYKNGQGNLIGYSNELNPNINNDIVVDSSKSDGYKFVYKDKNGNVIGVGNENMMVGKDGIRRVGQRVYAEGGDMPMQEQEMGASPMELSDEQIQQILGMYLQQLPQEEQQAFLASFEQASEEAKMQFINQLAQQMQ